MGKPVEVGDSNFQQEVLDSDKPVLVDFWATWCGPCKMIAPVVEQVADEYEGRLKVAKVDVDQNQATARQYGVMSIPTMVVFKGGKAVERVVGFTPKANLIKAIEPHL
jgi:thioredoxin 1